MTKRIIALLLVCCLICSAAPVNAGAASGQQISANAVTVTAGYTAYVTLQAENFEKIAALDVYIYYDAGVFTISGTSNGSMLSGAQASVNTAEDGTIKLSAMALDGISGTGDLLTVYFETAADCTPGTYPVTVAIGRAYNTDLQPATVSGSNGSVTVEEPVVTEYYYLYDEVNSMYLKKGDTLVYQLRSYGQSFVSGEFTVEYDHELFAFDAIELEAALTGEGAVYSVNSSVLGQVRIAYANENPVDSYRLFAVKLKVLADTAATTMLTARAENMYRQDLSAYLPGSSYRTVTLEKMPQVTDYPDAFLQTDRLVVGKQSNSVFCLESGAGVAAADFTITYDPSVLRCVSVTMAQGLEAVGGMVVINDNYQNGAIRFSYINMDAYGDEKLPLVQIVWEPLQSAHYVMTPAAEGVVDTQQTPIVLEYVTDTGCIYVATVTEPTCQTEGHAVYLCACGDSFTEVIPTIPEEACTHYTVTFVNDGGKVISSQEYHYGDEVVIPEDPTKAADNACTYTFAGWDREIATSCIADATYTATYTSFDIDYTVTFVDEDGTVLSAKTYHWGDPIEIPENPTKAANEMYTYTFTGWDKDVVNCAGNATYTATYKAAYIDYTVTFVDADGTVLSTKTYHWGDCVEVPKNPTKAADHTYTYTFAGWDKEVVTCAGNATYTATYASEYIDYTVTFVNEDGTVLSAKTYHWGDPVEIPEDPTKAADNTYTYTFVGWDQEVVNCAGDATYQAKYTPVYIDYTITFVDEDGTVLSAKTYHWGDPVEIPENPTKAADHTYTYTFTGWDKEVTGCTGNATYTATYKASYIDYTVTFQYADGTVISEKTYHYGDTVIVPEDPAVPEALGSEYVFKGWDKEVTDCTANAVYTAVFRLLYPLGDFNKDYVVTNEDVIYLLWHTLFPESYPIDTLADFNHDDLVTNEDVIYLLWHTLFPESYPLTEK